MYIPPRPPAPPVAGIPVCGCTGDVGPVGNAGPQGPNGIACYPCADCTVNTVETADGFCAFTNGNTGQQWNLSGKKSQLTIALNGTGPFATPSPSLLSAIPTSICKFKTKTIEQVAQGSKIKVVQTYVSNNNIITTVQGSISYGFESFGTTYQYTGTLGKSGNSYYWYFNMVCGPPTSCPSPEDCSNSATVAVGPAAYTPDFTGMMPTGGGGFNNLLPFTKCGAGATQGLTMGGFVTITLSDPSPASFCNPRTSQTISAFATIPSQTPEIKGFSINPPTSTSGLPVEISVKSGPAILNGYTVNLTGQTGTVVLSATQSGNDQYEPAQEVTTSFTVEKNNQTLANFALIDMSGNPITSVKPSQPPFFIFAPPTKSPYGYPIQGLSVTLSLKSGPAIIEYYDWTWQSDIGFSRRYRVTLTGISGTVVIAANQAGDAEYAPAPEQTASFTVGKQQTTILPFNTIPSKPVGNYSFQITLPEVRSNNVFIGISTVSVKSGPASYVFTDALGNWKVMLNGQRGTVVLAANYAGSSDYYAATEVTTSFEVV